MVQVSQYKVDAEWYEATCALLAAVNDFLVLPQSRSSGDQYIHNIRMRLEDVRKAGGW